jgi:GDPmannose 4,6-dehydratase
MWMMMQQKSPEDYVLATGETHTVKEFVDLSFKSVGIELEWEGKEEKEKGKDKNTGKVLVSVDPTYYRPTEVDLLIGDAY